MKTKISFGMVYFNPPPFFFFFFFSFQTNVRGFQRWATAVLNGCFGTPSAYLEDALSALYPDIFNSTSPEVELVIPPPSTSRNATIFMGVPHSLNYGYAPDESDDRRQCGNKRDIYVYTDDKDSEQVISTDDEDSAEGENAERQGPDQGINRGRAEKRVLLSKSKREYTKRSRSRSPLSSDDEVDLPVHVVSIAPRPPGRRGHTIQTMLANPDHYYLKSESYFKFFEPHKPDLLCRNHEVVDHVRVRFVCEIASWLKESRRNRSLPKLVGESTEQCVQSALAALAHDQNHILGIVVVPDGMKVINIKRKRRSYKIHETPLVLWSEEQKLFSLLNMIKKVLV